MKNIKYTSYTVDVVALLFTFSYELFGANVQQYTKKVAMQCFYITSVPLIFTTSIVTYDSSSPHLHDVHSSAKNNPTDLNNQAYLNSFTSRYMILSHIVGLLCIRSAGLNVRHMHAWKCLYVLYDQYKGLKHVHDSVKALTPTLSSVCKNTGHHIVTRPPVYDYHKPQ